MSLGQAVLVWLIELSLLGIGLVWGYKFAKGASQPKAVPSRARHHAVEISRVRDEYKAYRDDVSHQFSDINSSVRDLNRAYGALFHHMAEGSRRLVKEGNPQEFALSNDEEFVASIKALANRPAHQNTVADAQDREKAAATS